MRAQSSNSSKPASGTFFGHFKTCQFRIDEFREFFMGRRLALSRKPLAPQSPPDRLTARALFCSGVARPDSTAEFTKREVRVSKGRGEGVKGQVLAFDPFRKVWHSLIETGHETHQNNHFLSKDHFRFDAVSISTQLSPKVYYQQ